MKFVENPDFAVTKIYNFHENLQIIENSICYVFYPIIFISNNPAELGAHKNQQQSAMMWKSFKYYVFVDEFVEITQQRRSADFWKIYKFREK